MLILPCISPPFALKKYQTGVPWATTGNDPECPPLIYKEHMHVHISYDMPLLLCTQVITSKNQELSKNQKQQEVIAFKSAPNGVMFCLPLEFSSHATIASAQLRLVKTKGQKHWWGSPFHFWEVNKTQPLSHSHI